MPERLPAWRCPAATAGGAAARTNFAHPPAPQGPRPRWRPPAADPAAPVLTAAVHYSYCTATLTTVSQCRAAVRAPPVPSLGCLAAPLQPPLLVLSPCPTPLPGPPHRPPYTLGPTISTFELHAVAERHNAPSRVSAAPISFPRRLPRPNSPAARRPPRAPRGMPDALARRTRICFCFVSQKSRVVSPRSPTLHPAPAASLIPPWAAAPAAALTPPHPLPLPSPSLQFFTMCSLRQAPSCCTSPAAVFPMKGGWGQPYPAAPLSP